MPPLKNIVNENRSISPRLPDMSARLSAYALVVVVAMEISVPSPV